MFLDRGQIIAWLSAMPELRATKPSRDGIFICCPFHGDTDPSLHVSLGGRAKLGAFHCFGCGHHGGWRDLAERLGLPHNPRLISDDNVERTSASLAALHRKNESRAVTQLGYAGHLWEVDRPWRGLSVSFLRKIGAAYCHYRKWDRLFLPVTVKGKLVAYIKAKLDEDDSGPKYYNQPGPWATKYVFPADYFVPSRRVVIVEGPFDALRMNYHGIPTVAVLGSTNWTEAKALYLLSRGVTKALVVGDGDEAGYKLNQEVLTSLGRYIKVEVHPLKIFKEKARQVDPGNVKHRTLRRIREHLLDL